MKDQNSHPFSLVSYFLLIGAFVLLCPAINIAQSEGFMTIKGKVMLLDAGLKDVKVELYKNGVKTTDMVTKGNGKFTFCELPITPEGDNYIIKHSKPGHITVKHWISTKAPDERKVQFPVYQPEVELFKVWDRIENDKALNSVMTKPISKFAYRPSIGDFEDDRAYFTTIADRVEQLFDFYRAEERERYLMLAEYRRNKEEWRSPDEVEAAIQYESGKLFREQYQAGIEKADRQFDANNLKKAKILYQQVIVQIAKSKLPKADRDQLKKYPKKRIFEIECTLANEIEEEEKIQVDE